ncbi:Gfo/Idh/MocA family protein [Actinopolymorpha alba]|uniref:Gfo/Idh/MocA family protein n=1 Tax=Actinopolymorpha alba TaxID=533267 RepID=UPI0003820FCB|nr:Gfo/Idh/MocA family oxidoreductase [Actinopolymorpha alba]
MTNTTVQHDPVQLRVGLLGVNTSQASVFARMLNAERVIPGARISWVWGGELRPDQPDATTLARTYAIEEVVGEPTEALAETDLVLVVEGSDNGANHVPLARPFVAAGVPTFIDKPMSAELVEARMLFRLAAERGVPVTSSSALRYARELRENRDRIARMGRLSSVVSVGPGRWFFHSIHGLEQLHTLLGPGVEWVRRFAWPDRDVAVLGYPDGRPSAVVQTLRDAEYRFHLTMYAEKGWYSLETNDYDAFYRGQLRAVVEMARTGIPPVAPEETLELLAILHAGVRSEEAGGQPVRVADVLAE